VIFGTDGDLLVPTDHARSPWDPGMQHGGAVSAVLARALERVAPDFQLARLTVDLLAPVPLAPFRVDADVWKPGRRLQLARATLTMQDGREMARAGAVLLHRQELHDLPEDTAGPPLPGKPGEGELDDFDRGTDDAFHRTGVEMRWIEGTWRRGPGTVWVRLAHPVVDDEDPTPAMRAAAAADFSLGVSRVLAIREWIFINPDLTVQLHRPPVGEWVALDARSIAEPGGVGLSIATLHDGSGPVGTAQQTLYITPR